MAWCHQALINYLNQCWQRSMMPYVVTRPQWVNTLSPGCCISDIHYHCFRQQLVVKGIMIYWVKEIKYFGQYSSVISLLYLNFCCGRPLPQTFMRSELLRQYCGFQGSNVFPTNITRKHFQNVDRDSKPLLLPDQVDQFNSLYAVWLGNPTTPVKP